MWVSVWIDLTVLCIAETKFLWFVYKAVQHDSRKSRSQEVTGWVRIEALFVQLDWYIERFRSLLILLNLIVLKLWNNVGIPAGRVLCKQV